jgi:hypothetical protein
MWVIGRLAWYTRAGAGPSLSVCVRIRRPVPCVSVRGVLESSFCGVVPLLSGHRSEAGDLAQRVLDLHA